MNRQDIIDKMTLSEKEFFEKYKDTYPFPIRKFIEEIGIKIEYDDDPVCFNKTNWTNNIFYISNHDNVRKMKISKNIKDVLLTLQLLTYFFYRDNPMPLVGKEGSNELSEEDKILVCVFLMPHEVFREQVFKLKGNLKKVAKYFGVPPMFIEFYCEYQINEVMNVLYPYNNARDDIKYH